MPVPERRLTARERVVAILFNLSLLASFFLFLGPDPDDQEERSTLVFYSGNFKEDTVIQDRDYWYKYITDSLNWQKEYNREIREARGGNYELSFMGVIKVSECDTCTYRRNFQDLRNNTKYYFSLPGYRLRKNFSFAIEKGANYLYKGDGDISYYTDFPSFLTKKEVRFRFAYRGKTRDSNTRLLFPISPLTYKVMSVLILIIQIAFAIILFFFLLIYALDVLKYIAWGYPFIEQNIRKLYLIGVTVLIMGLIRPVFSGLIYFILSPEVRESFYYPFMNEIRNNRGWLLTGIIVLLLARAFRHGLRIQKEQELTV